MHRLLYIILFVILSHGHVFAQENMTLNKAISVGLENNFNIKINDANILIAENNNTWGMAGGGPEVNLNFNFSNNLTKDNNEASFLKGTYYTGAFGPSLNAQWVVYSGGRIKLAKEQLSTTVSQQMMAKESEIHDLMRSIYQAYYNVIFQKERLDLLQGNLDLSKSRLSYEETKKSFGSSNSYNLIQFENAIISDTTILMTQKQNVEVAERSLFDILDMAHYPNFTFTESLNVTYEELNEENLSDILSEENYTLKTLDMITSLNRLNTQMQKSALKPTVSLNSSLAFSQNSFNSSEINFRTEEPFGFVSSNRWDGNISANLSWNLIDGGVRKTNIENAQIQEEMDQLSLLEAKATLSNQLGILVSNYKSQQDLLQLSDDQMNIAERNLNMTEERFKAGLITSLDYRNVQIQRLSAAFNKASAIYNLIVTKSEIDYLVGRYD